MGTYRLLSLLILLLLITQTIMINMAYSQVIPLHKSVLFPAKIDSIYIPIPKNTTADFLVKTSKYTLVFGRISINRKFFLRYTVYDVFMKNIIESMNISSISRRPEIRLYNGNNYIAFYIRGLNIIVLTYGIETNNPKTYVIRPNGIPKILGGKEYFCVITSRNTYVFSNNTLFSIPKEYEGEPAKILFYRDRLYFVTYIYSNGLFDIHLYAFKISNDKLVFLGKYDLGKVILFVSDGIGLSNNELYLAGSFIHVYNASNPGIKLSITDTGVKPIYSYVSRKHILVFYVKNRELYMETYNLLTSTYKIYNIPYHGSLSENLAIKVYEGIGDKYYILYIRDLSGRKSFYTVFVPDLGFTGYVVIPYNTRFFKVFHRSTLIGYINSSKRGDSLVITTLNAQYIRVYRNVFSEGIAFIEDGNRTYITVPYGRGFLNYYLLVVHGVSVLITYDIPVLVEALSKATHMSYYYISISNIGVFTIPSGLLNMRYVSRLGYSGSPDLYPYVPVTAQPFHVYIVNVTSYSARIIISGDRAEISFMPLNGGGGFVIGHHGGTYYYYVPPGTYRVFIRFSNGVIGSGYLSISNGLTYRIKLSNYIIKPGFFVKLVDYVIPAIIGVIVFTALFLFLVVLATVKTIPEE